MLVQVFKTQLYSQDIFNTVLINLVIFRKKNAWKCSKCSESIISRNSSLILKGSIIVLQFQWLKGVKSLAKTQTPSEQKVTSTIWTQNRTISLGHMPCEVAAASHMFGRISSLSITWQDSVWLLIHELQTYLRQLSSLRGVWHPEVPDSPWCLGKPPSIKPVMSDPRLSY